MSFNPAFYLGPVLLRPDNFVPFAKTPWAGDVLTQNVKAEVIGGDSNARIGESWEFSIDPGQPSRTAIGSRLLAEVIKDDIASVLSFERAARGENSVNLLVKLLDTGAPLSFQVHPFDYDDGLAADESGKLESWLVLAAKPGSGIYLGFSRKIAKDDLRDRLGRGSFSVEDLHFEPVQPGDYFEIDPGVPHAIGAGVTLIEPQRVVPGKQGKTYRLWDFGRLFDKTGKPDPSGKPRPLHVEESLRLIDPERQVGAEFARSLRRKPLVEQRNGVKCLRFPGNAYYQTTSWTFGHGAQATLNIKGGYGVLVMLSGALLSAGALIRTGDTALLPHASMPLTLTALESSQCVIFTPGTSPVSF